MKGDEVRVHKKEFLKVFHYCIKNPIPKEYVIKGQTWQWLIGFMNVMWRQAIGEHQEINYVKIDKN